MPVRSRTTARPSQPSREVWSPAARQEWLSSLPALSGPGPFWPTEEPDSDWRIRFTERFSDKGLPAFMDHLADAGFRELVERAKTRLESGLLCFGGWGVCSPALDDDLDRVIGRGVLLDGHGARLVPGRGSACHQNAAAQWSRRPGASGIMTGYALSEDGVWREHSWLAEARPGGLPGLVETTVRREAYFGFLRTPDEARAFSADFDHSVSASERIEEMRTRLLAVDAGISESDALRF